VSDDEMFSLDDVTAWVEPGSSVFLRIDSPGVGLAELSASQARKLAAALLRMADMADT
jgi:hypothetical protein